MGWQYWIKLAKLNPEPRLTFEYQTFQVQLKQESNAIHNPMVTIQTLIKLTNRDKKLEHVVTNYSKNIRKQNNWQTILIFNISFICGQHVLQHKPDHHLASHPQKCRFADELLIRHLRELTSPVAPRFDLQIPEPLQRKLLIRPCGL